MAQGGEGPKLATAVLENLTVGWTPFQPPHATQWNPAGDVVYVQGPAFESADNLRWHDGVMQMRQASVPLAAGAEQWPGADPELVDSLSEEVYFIFQVFNDADIPREPVTILVTTAEIAIWTPGASAWERITPRYFVGEVNVTNGSTTVNGVNTFWLTNNIHAGAIMEMPNGDHHTIESVDSEDPGPGINEGNNVATLKTAYAGPTASFQIYVIRRVFFNNDPTTALQFLKNFNLFARIFNGDLYVAGSNVGGNGVAAVLQIPNVIVGPSPHIYLMSDRQLDPTMPPESIIPGIIDTINGLEVLQDGRVVVATEEDGERLSRIRYSSPVDLQRWNLSPGGFTDIVAGGDRQITGIERLGRTLAIHYDDTIVVGQPTGQDDPPLAYDTSRAETGAGWGRAIKTIGNQQMFVNKLGVVHTFTGSGTQEVTQAFRKSFQDYFSYRSDNEMVAWVDQLRQEFLFSFEDDGPTTFQPTYLVGAVNYRDGAPRREFHPRQVTGASDALLNQPGFTGSSVPGGAADGSRNAGSALVGGAFRSGATAAASDDGVFRLRERIGEDNQWSVPPNSAPQPELITYPLDFGFPGSEKVIERVTLIVRQPVDTLDTSDGSQTITVRLSRDDGALYEQSVILSLDFTTNPTKPRILDYIFEERLASESFRISILFGSPTKPTLEPIKWLHQLTKVWVRFSVLGEQEGMYTPSAEAP